MIRKSAHRPGITIIEITIALALLSIVAFTVYTLFAVQLKLFFNQITGIGVSSQNKIALEEITNQTRQAESISLTCPSSPAGPCAVGEVGSGQTSVVYRLWGLDVNGKPTVSYYDYMVFKQTGTNLTRSIYKNPSSTRPASTNHVIATDLDPNNGLTFSYNDTDYTKANQVTFIVKTTKTENGKTQSISQSAKARIRNQPVVSKPDVTTLAASAITDTTATLNGSANPNTLTTTGWFRYNIYSPNNRPGYTTPCDTQRCSTPPCADTDTFGTRVPVSNGTDVGNGFSAIAYSQGISSLTGNTSYYFCAIASNSKGTNFGSVLSFTTLPPPQPPTVTTLPASDKVYSSATLNGTVNPNGLATTAWFRYSTTNPGTCNNTFGTRVPVSDGTNLNGTNVGAGYSPIAYSQGISGLTAETTYYFCAIGNNSLGTGFGNLLPQPFTTQTSYADKDTECDALGGTTVKIDVPDNTANGDVMIMLTGTTNGANAGNKPTGWGEIGSALHNSNVVSSRIFWRKANNEPADYTIDGFTEGENRCAAIMNFKNIDTSGNPVDAFSAKTNNPASNDIIADAIPTIAPKTQVVFLTATAGEFVGHVTGYSGTNPTFTERFDVDTIFGSADIEMGGANGTRTGAGSTGTRTAFWNFGGNSVLSNAYLVALKMN